LCICWYIIQTNTNKRTSIRDVTNSSVLVDRIQGSNDRLLFQDPKQNIAGNSGV